MSVRPPAPRVSIIIPTFNRAWSLTTAIDSVLSQDFDAFETIVVDDGSTDETRALLAGYGAALRVIQQANRGVSAARNAGIRAAAAPLVALLDSDDYWLPDKLAVQTTFFDQNPEAVICQTEELWIRNGVRVNPGKRHRKRGGMIFEPSLGLCLVSPSAVMLRRSLFESVGFFDEQLPACEDYDLWLRISCRHPVHLIDRPLIVKRGGHPDQLSRSPGLDRHRVRAICRLLAQNVLTADQRRAAWEALAAKCAVYAAGCRKRGRPDEAQRCLALIEGFRPKT
ncbi:MAG: glycosyltransferase [Desulfobacterales bacterium]